jgi:hypothetical protein
MFSSTDNIQTKGVVNQHLKYLPQFLASFLFPV